MGNGIALIERNEAGDSDERRLAMSLFGLDGREDDEDGDEIHRRKEAE